MKNNTVIVKVDNFDRVRQAIGAKGLMDAAMSGGRVIKSHASNYAPKDTSNLANSIVAEPTESSPTSAWVQIGTNVIYALIQELGGMIVPKVKKFLSWVDEAGNRIFARAVQIKAQPYMRPAVDNHKGEIAGAVSAAISGSLKRATK